MDEKFVIVEVLTSADYYAAADALDNLAEDKRQDLYMSAYYTDAERAEQEAAIARMGEQAERFRNVAAQVREQEAKTHGL